MTPLFSLVAATLLPWGYDAFVVVPPPAAVAARRGRVSELQAKAPTVDEIQQREDARAALLDSGGVDKLMDMLTKLRESDTDIGAEPAPAPAPAPAPKVRVLSFDLLLLLLCRHTSTTLNSPLPLRLSLPAGCQYTNGLRLI